MAVRTNTALKEHQREYKQDKCCEFCGKLLDADFMTVDHIIPRSLYGKPNDERNWQVLCKDCHYKKTEMEVLVLKGLWDEVPVEYRKFKGLEILANKTKKARHILHFHNNHSIKLNRKSFNKAHIYFNHKDLEA